ncbi:MAG: peptidoglycan DD-metalloendopeptidase family protein [Spirochaetes bacterium]|nr:peptidoglycan DD-metalloendopeptidase family protein [Spirochaetota bacterium]
MNGMPISRYNLDLFRRVVLLFSTAVIIIFFSVNIIMDLITDEIDISKDSYYLKQGFPIFTDKDAYISLVKNYPYDIGAALHIHVIARGETLWDVALMNSITIDTLISANPTLKDLLAVEGDQLVVPDTDGTVLACDDSNDAEIMAELMNIESDNIKGNFTFNPFRLFCRDNMRLVFLKGQKPLIVNNNIEGLYDQKMQFKSPIKGYYTSMYGMRRDPFSGVPTFHDGLDIQNRIGAPIKPIKKGIVSFTGWRDGYGNMVRILHEDGYVSYYAHCSEILVETGEIVTTDTVIALVGSTGKSTGPHLHLSVERHGSSLDPIFFVW